MRTALGALLALLLLTSCSKSARVFSDGGPVADIVPPPPRNVCEELFRARLMSNLGNGTLPLPPISDENLLRVMNACSAAELVEANRYYVFGAGPPGGQLLVHRLLEGRSRDDQRDRLRAICQREALEQTKACQSGA